MANASDASTIQETGYAAGHTFVHDNVEHAINMEAVAQVVAQPGGIREVQLTKGEKLSPQVIDRGLTYWAGRSLISKVSI